MRRDGFASLDAGDTEAAVTTRPVQFSGCHLFVNLATAADGELRAEILDADNRVIAPFTRENSLPLRTDQTRHAVKWQGADDLAAVTGRAVKIRFHLRRASLYAFWTSRDPSGNASSLS